MKTLKTLFVLMVTLLAPLAALASGGGQEAHATADLTRTIYGYLGVVIFVLAYSLVPLENNIHLRKSKPVLLAAGIIWVLLAIAYVKMGDTHTAHEAIRHSLLEYAELFLFLLAAMTYINAMEERNVFQTLRAFLVSRGFTLRQVFWITGLLAFFISPIADNLTTALLMGAVVMAVGGDNKAFVALACINVVIAANAGGAFSPFGDITTLMVWQKGHVAFSQFFNIFIPSLVNWLVPAIIMSLTIPKSAPKVLDEEVTLKYGALMIIALFLLTITTAVCFHNFLHLPPAAGMMLGLAFLGLFSYHIKLHEGRSSRYDGILGMRGSESFNPLMSIFKSSKRLDRIIENFSEPIFAIDMERRVTHWNKACERLTGRSAKEMVGSTNQWQPFHKLKRPVLAEFVLDRLPEKEVAQYYEGEFRRNPVIEGGYDATVYFDDVAGQPRWLNFSAAPLMDEKGQVIGAVEVLEDFTDRKSAVQHFDIMEKIARAEWDTLMFFYGVILCVGGLAQFGYLNALSVYAYHDMGATYANIMVGFLSAIVDNIPVMFAVLTMDPAMSVGQWLLVTLTAGVGGSMLSIGSAAGVALMGTARGTYTFGVHLKWTPVIALGYGASILCHLFINARLM
jgi:PAS domain S-box-containing protein